MNMTTEAGIACCVSRFLLFFPNDPLQTFMARSYKTFFGVKSFFLARESNFQCHTVSVSLSIGTANFT